MNRVALELYRFIVIPAAIVLLPLLSIFNRKIRAGFRLRRQRYESLTASQPPLWIHAASGEFEYAKAVIREFKLLRPDVPVVVTYFSPTFAKAVTSFPGVERAIALPLDLPGPTRSFLKRLEPRLLLIARTDLWPELLAQCQQLKVPVQVFSYTQKVFSSALKRWFTRWIFAGVERIYCVSEADRANLLCAHVTNEIEVLGDTRYDQVAYRLQNPKPIHASLHPSGTAPILVAGSTWPEDEAVLLPALVTQLRAGTLKLVLVPHEPTAGHLSQLEAQLKNLGLSSARFSANQTWDAAAVLLVDQVGYLAELYSWGSLAFVGGSFRRSVHSVMEALGAACFTFVGPMHTNNREAMEFKELKLIGENALCVVHDSAEMEKQIGDLIAHPERLTTHRQALKSEFTKRLGASRALAHKIASLWN